MVWHGTYCVKKRIDPSGLCPFIYHRLIIAYKYQDLRPPQPLFIVEEGKYFKLSL